MIFRFPINTAIRLIFNKAKHVRATNHRRNGFTQTIRCLATRDSSKNFEEYSQSHADTKVPGPPQEDANEKTTNSAEDSDIEQIYDREFVEMKSEDYEALYKDDKTDSVRTQIETLLKEYEFMKYNSMGRVPSFISELDMERLLEEGSSPISRTRLFHFFFKREMAKLQNMRQKAREKAEKQALAEVRYTKMGKKFGDKKTGLLSDDGQLIYGLWHNSLFCRIPENRLKLANTESQLAAAALFGTKIVFDFDFEQHMSKQTLRSCLDQVQESYGTNRYQYKEPFDLWFCNLDEKSKSFHYLENNAMRNLYSGSMITVKDDCFTNYFDKSRLVYLSPNAKTPLEDVGRNDDVYIIGVFNDKGNAKPISYRKAESLQIRSRSLPLDKYISWQGGSKSLCINHVISILLEVVANGGDWRNALLRCVPSRKIKPIEIIMEEERQRMARRKKVFNLREDFEF